MTATYSGLHTAHVLLVGATDWVEVVDDALRTHTEASVQTVPTTKEALRVFHGQSVNCVISEYELDESTGIELLRLLRDETETLPVLLCTASGSEAIASEAVSAGVTDYIALSESPDERIERVLECAEQGVRSAQRTTVRRNRARQFDAIFHDSRAATWILDPDGSLVRANQTAREMIDRDVESIVGEPFWTLPWWSQTKGLESEVRQIIEAATAGEFTNEVVTRTLVLDDSQILKLSAHLVRNERENINSLVVEGVDITNQKERRHERQTFINRVTDGVVEVDENWCFTLVDDRAEEHYEMNEDDLLGQYFWDIFSQARGTPFEEVYRGVMKTREPATIEEYSADLDSWYHVEVYPTSDGGVSFYFQDITDRKRHEKRIAGLNDTLAEFMETESKRQVCDIVTEVAEETLNFPVMAIALYDDQKGVLRPTAEHTAVEGLLDATPLLDVGDNAGWDAFVNDDSRRVRDPLEDADTSIEPAITELAIFPLNHHGILLTGSTSAEGFAPADINFAETVAANTTAALDRADREQQLQKRETILQEKNETLDRLSRVNDIIRSIDQALVRASSRTEIEEAVCEHLAAVGPYELAWIGEHDSVAQEVEPTEWAGAEKGFLDALTITTDDRPEGQGPVGQAVKTGNPQVVNNILDDSQYEPWRQDALNRGYHATISLPLHYDESLYGVLNVYASQPGVFDDIEQAVLTEMADTIAYAINAVESKKAIVSNEVTRLEFTVDDTDLQIVKVARELDCEFSLESLVPRTDGRHRMFFSTRGVPADDFVKLGSRLPVTDLSLISEYEKGGDSVSLFEASLDDSSLATTILEHGGRPRSISVKEGTATVTIELAADAAVREFVEMFQTKYSDSTLTAQRNYQRSQQTTQEFQSAVTKELTARQLEVLQIAYFNGYFEEPRTQTASEIADTLDIAQPTFNTHIRTGQRKLYRHLFEEESLQA